MYLTGKHEVAMGRKVTVHRLRSASVLAWLVVVGLAVGQLSMTPTMAESTPMARVKIAVDEVLVILRDKTGDRETRWQRVSTVVQEHFDFDGMSRRVLATEWRRATPEERAQFSQYFSQYIESTFRSKFETYDSQQVEYLAERVKGDKATVESVVVADNVRTPVTYKLRKAKTGSRAGEWFAYDVVIEGVSLVANYRNTFAAIAKSEGMDGLIADVQRRIAKQRRLEKREKK